ncbi:MAG TPA: hypothetical protein PKC05_04405 [Candidatus Saccharibacteria bacterium]|nr:hypothetical protein [Candidatus Saccharibacteria bacterium]
MIEQVDQKVDVLALSRKGRGIVVPLRMRWNSKTYLIKKIGLHHPVREGRVLYHIFECTDGNTFFRLKYNTESLQWSLEKISDGLPT